MGTLHATTLDPAVRAHAGIPHPRPFVAEITLGADDLSDVLPHLNNVRALHWIDRVAEAHSSAAGFGSSALRDTGVMWFVGRHELDYFAECFAGERLLLCTWVRTAAGVRAWRDTCILKSDGKPAVRAASLWVLVDLETRRPRRIPKPMLLAADPLEPASVDDLVQEHPPCGRR